MESKFYMLHMCHISVYYIKAQVSRYCETGASCHDVGNFEDGFFEMKFMLYTREHNRFELPKKFKVFRNMQGFG